MLENSIILVTGGTRSGKSIVAENLTLTFSNKPIYIATNGCYIFNRDLALDQQKFLSNNPSLFEVDSFTAKEIKDIKDYKIAREMITMYFQEDLDV